MIRSGLIQILARAVLMCALAELGAFAILVGEDVLHGKRVVAAVRGRLAQHPLAPKTTVPYGAFDPVVGQRYTPNTRLGNVTVNAQGFIANDGNDSALDDFPDKPPGVFRILLLGSSTVAGSALRSDGSHTIAAVLERRLNARASTGRRYEVLNFGFSGATSFMELRRLAGEGLYMKPDLVISLDGWLDAVESAFGTERSGLPHGMINWGQISYGQNDLVAGATVVQTRPPYVFTYIYLLLDNAGFFPRSRVSGRAEQYEAMPWYRQSARLLAEPGGLQAALAKNLAAMAAICQANDIAFIDYLQPFADYFRKPNAEEQHALDDYHATLVRTGDSYWERAHYAAAIRPYYIAYGALYRALQAKFADRPTIRFFDITDLFEDTAVRVYLNSAHYNEEGNRLVADRMADDVERLLIALPRR